MEFHLDFSKGFLPNVDPLTSLPPALGVWDELGSNLPKLLLSDDWDEIFNHLPVLPTELLTSSRELERAMMLLSFFGHAHVWRRESSPTKIPKSIAIPWHQVAKKLARPPILSYASYALNNWRRLDAHKPIELGNIVLLQNFLGGIDEEWFVLIHVDIEMKASKALQQIILGLDAVNADSGEDLQRYLKIIGEALEGMCQTLDRMPEHCDPYIYYNRVRPYIHGWKDNPALPNGIIYEGVVEYEGQPQQFRGETGAQSSIIPALDAFFGIQHHSDPLRVYLMEMRDYMPLEHRNFLQSLEQRRDSVRNYILKKRLAHPHLSEWYNTCIQLLSRFRQTHLSFAARYIQKQSQSSVANPTEIGTGGTPFMEYLKKHKDETLNFLID